MSYANALALQSAVYQHLSADALVQSHVGGAIYDAIPAGSPPDLYISLGSDTARNASDKTGHGAWHNFSVSVMSTTPGFATAKTVAAAICDALIDADLTLNRGHLVSLTFDRARATRIDANNGRQIELRFRARICDS
jgi:hypothetical protein